MKDTTIVSWPEYKSILRDIRKVVFIDEQAVPESDEWDEFDEDPHTLHLLAQDADTPVGTLRIVNDGKQQFKITRLAILKEYRRRGWASRLLKAAMAIIIGQAFERIYLHAQLEAASLYKEFGFKTEGEEFLEAGIAHQTMVFDQSNTGIYESIFASEVLRLDSTQAFTEHAIHQVHNARRQVLMSSSQLRDDIFSNEALVDALSAFARRERHAEVLILVHDKSSVNDRSLPLIRLAQRLSSKVKIKILTEEGLNVESFMCCDTKALIFFNVEDNPPRGFSCYRAKQESKQLSEKFQHHWDHCSDSDPNLRQIFI